MSSQIQGATNGCVTLIAASRLVMPMLSSMTFNSIVALFSAMVVMASIPSVSVLAVSTRSATFGFLHGVFTTIGVVVGDIIFIAIALLGLSLIAAKMGSLFILIKYLGGAYLIFSGIQLYRSKLRDTETKEIVKISLFSSFLTGLLITLGDQKATLFYLVFFPAFFDISKISYFDAAIVIGIATVAVGGVKLFYALIANRASFLIRPQVNKGINIFAGSVMVAVGVLLIGKP
jgi:threonine/homoserine/homoserine lactone efflux protein